MLEIYPDKYYEIDICNYEFEKAREILYLDRKCFRCRLWWIGDQSISDMCFQDHIGNCCHLSTM